MITNNPSFTSKFSEVRRLNHPNDPFVSVCHDWENEVLVACTYSPKPKGDTRIGRIVLLDRQTMDESWSSKLPSGAFHLEPIRRTGKFVMGLADGQVGVFDAKRRELQIDRPEPFHKIMITDAKMTKNLEKMILTDNGGAVRMYDRDTGTVVFERPEAHRLRGTAVSAWSCEFISDMEFVSGGDDNLLKVWDTRVGTEPVRMNKSHNGGIVRTRTIQHYGTPRLCTGSYDDTLRLFDLRSLTEPTHSKKFDGGVWDFEFIPGTQRLLVANMLNGWAVLDAKSLDTLYARQMPEMLIYGITSASDPEFQFIYCCSFNEGVMWQFEESNPSSWW